MFWRLRAWVWVLALFFGAAAARPTLALVSVFAQDAEREEDGESSQSSTSEAEIRLQVFRSAHEVRLWGPARVTFYSHCSESPRSFPPGVRLLPRAAAERCRLQI